MGHNWKRELAENSTYYDILALGKDRVGRLPFSLRILLENLLRHADTPFVSPETIEAFFKAAESPGGMQEIPFFPARVLMQDFTGVPAVVDLAALRDAMSASGNDPQLINPKIPVDLVVDHSIQVDYYGSPDALEKNVAKEYERNHERYTLLKWAQKHFRNFRVVPPNSGICHQVNLEFLAQVVQQDGNTLYPDTLVGTDSHTTMINGLGVLGWGVGGIEAEAVMLGQPYSMPVPEVVGFKLTGELSAGCTASDVVLAVTQMLREATVVGAFVEFFGPGLRGMSLPDRATIANMSPEYGATMGFFPVDDVTLEFLRFTGRYEAAERTELYCKANGLFYHEDEQPVYSRVLELDMTSVRPSVAGPSRPQDRLTLDQIRPALERIRPKDADPKRTVSVVLDGTEVALHDGSLAIASITSCTNTSNPAVMIGAGLLARNAVKLGLTVPAWVKTSLAPGSRAVEDYLKDSGLLSSLEELGFHITAFGCVTCIGNSGPLHAAVEAAQKAHELVLTSAISGNRNFEGRIHQRIKGSFLMSPILVVAYALAGRMDIDLTTEPLGRDLRGREVFLDEIWPGAEEIDQTVRRCVTSEHYARCYASVFEGDAFWKALDAPEGDAYTWDPASSYIIQPPFFQEFLVKPQPCSPFKDAYALLVLGSSVTTDHISPAGTIPAEYPSGQYLQSLGISPESFNSYGSRRGNHDVLVRGTFANIRIRNLLAAPAEGGYTAKLPDGDIMFVYDAAQAYAKEGRNLIVLGGKEYGTGSSRDWAAKGTHLLGIKAVLAESFERIHRSNLVGMGILPLTFMEGENRESLGLTGKETFTLEPAELDRPGMVLNVTAVHPSGTTVRFQVRCRLDTEVEVAYYAHGGILPYVLRNLMSGSSS